MVERIVLDDRFVNCEVCGRPTQVRVISGQVQMVTHVGCLGQQRITARNGETEGEAESVERGAEGGKRGAGKANKMKLAGEDKGQGEGDEGIG